MLQTKLLKAQKLANNPKNNKFFEIHERDNYFMKDAIDKKHGFYFLRVGTDSNKNDLNLKIKIFL